MPLAVGMLSLNPWTAMEAPLVSILKKEKGGEKKKKKRNMLLDQEKKASN